MKSHAVTITEAQEHGLDVYRKIRNHLHHHDGKAFDGKDGEEIHLFPEQLENFYEFFVWRGEFIENWRKLKLRA